MPRLWTVLGATFFFIASGLAQGPQNHAGMNMAGHESGAKPAENPAHRYLLMVFTLPEMEPELGLSAQQITQLRQHKQDYLATKGGDLAAAETAGKMEAVLTPQQLAKLAALTPADLHQAAMSRISAEEMAKLMDLMKDGGAEKTAGPNHAEKMHCEMMCGKEGAAGATDTGHHH